MGQRAREVVWRKENVSWREAVEEKKTREADAWGPPWIAGVE